MSDDINRFRISYRDGAYMVSIPNYDGGEVVRADLYDATNKTLAEFFRDMFAEDPIGVGEWLAQGEQDVDAFIATLDRLHPKNA